MPKHLLYGELKHKRHLYLTDTAFLHLMTLATANDEAPSEICEQIIRQHIIATAIPTTIPVSKPKLPKT